MHWGYFSKVVAPALTVRSGDRATIETLTHHAADDYDRMVAGDPGAESVFHWTREHKSVARRGAGPTEGPFQRGSGEGLGVHLLTGPVAVEGAEPGDVLEVRSSTSGRGRAAMPAMPAAASAPTPRRPGAFSITT